MKRTTRCKSCGSADLWRIDARPGIVAAIMRFFDRKPFQCRACGWIYYRSAKRVNERARPFPGQDGSLDSTASLLKLSETVEGAAVPRDGRKSFGSGGERQAEDHSIRVRY